MLCCMGRSSKPTESAAANHWPKHTYHQPYSIPLMYSCPFRANAHSVYTKPGLVSLHMRPDEQCWANRLLLLNPTIEHEDVWLPQSILTSSLGTLLRLRYAQSGDVR